MPLFLEAYQAAKCRAVLCYPLMTALIGRNIDRIVWHGLLLLWPWWPSSSSLPLLLMKGVRLNYVVMIIFANTKVIAYVTWECNMTGTYCFINNKVQQWFWMRYHCPSPINQYTNQKLVKWGICSILRKLGSERYRKCSCRSMTIEENCYFFVTKGGASVLL